MEWLFLLVTNPFSWNGGWIEKCPEVMENYLNILVMPGHLLFHLLQF